MHAYEAEEGHHSFALGDLAEDSDEEPDVPRKRTSFDDGEQLEVGKGAGLTAEMKSNVWKTP